MLPQAVPVLKQMELSRKGFGVKALRYPPSGMRKKEIRFAWDEETLGAVPRCSTIFYSGVESK